VAALAYKIRDTGAPRGAGMKDDGSRRSRFRRVAVARLHGRPDAGSVRLSRLSRASTVWTVDMETGEPYECDFAPASGSWLETEDGERYALAAQAVGRDGRPGGPYLTVTRIEDDGVVPALDPKTLGDAAGTPTGCELGGAIVIETFGSATNAVGRLQHASPAASPRCDTPPGCEAGDLQAGIAGERRHARFDTCRQPTQKAMMLDGEIFGLHPDAGTSLRHARYTHRIKNTAAVGGAITATAPNDPDATRARSTC
jgi:hypothetical protein